MQTLYSLLPVPLQHVAVTARGFYLRRQRYTAHAREFLRFLLQSDHWSPEEHARYQSEQLRRLVEHAMRFSPLYAESYREAGVDPRSLVEPGEVRRLPILSKEKLRRRGDDAVSTHAPRKKMWSAFTSGTTGTPLAAYHTHQNMQERLAFMQRLSTWYGLPALPRRASFTGKLIVDTRVGKPPFHRTNLALRQQLYSSHHLRPDLLPRYASALARFAPQQIDGIASPIFAVADHILRHDLVGSVQPALVVPTSETLWPHVRQRIERAFGAPVANHYGSQEGAPLAYECPKGGFHVCPESGIFEILDADGRPAPPGRVGRLVVTSFLSYGMPLIRYEIGDTASWRDEECPCGRAMPLLAGIEGRVDDMFYTSERGIVPRVDSAFKTLPPSIVATQVAQVGPDRFEVRLIPDESTFEPGHAATLVANLRDYLGESVRIDVRQVADLPRTAGGKLRAMVNECEDDAVRQPIAAEWNRENRAGDSG